MAFSKQQQKIVLSVLVVVLLLANIYRFVTAEKPKTAPLTYPRGAVATAPVRHGLPSPAASSDPLSVFFARRTRAVSRCRSRSVQDGESRAQTETGAGRPSCPG